MGNTARLIGDNIDIGAYECDTKMIQIIYVKEGSAVAGTGESWYSPTNDLQGAINLAELYANKNEGKYGYVFVDRNLKADNVNISMPGVKMFGSMREETSSKTEPRSYRKGPPYSEKRNHRVFQSIYHQWADTQQRNY